MTTDWVGKKLITRGPFKGEYLTRSEYNRRNRARKYGRPVNGSGLRGDLVVRIVDAHEVLSSYGVPKEVITEQLQKVLGV